MSYSYTPDIHQVYFGKMGPIIIRPYINNTFYVDFRYMRFIFHFCEINDVVERMMNGTFVMKGVIDCPAMIATLDAAIKKYGITNDS